LEGRGMRTPSLYEECLCGGYGLDAF